MTVGLFIDSLTGTAGYQEAVWRGVSDAARKVKIRIVTYVGSGLEYSALNPFAKTQNIAYDLFSPDTADGLILCGGTIGNDIGKEKFRDFCERFASKPVTSVGPAESRIPRVLVDNDRGMKDVILHLIKVHGYRKIACITGPKGNIDADRRLNMYLTTLGDNGIDVDKNLIYEGDFNETSGHDAVYRWIKEMGVTPEAIVASNDTMAFGAMDALQELGLMVPYSVAVTGFDDLKSAATATPPLTTVSQPMVVQGARALDILCRKIRGETVDLEILEDPALVCR